jgi:hypothetical protein
VREKMLNGNLHRILVARKVCMHIEPVTRSLVRKLLIAPCLEYDIYLPKMVI